MIAHTGFEVAMARHGIVRNCTDQNGMCEIFLLLRELNFLEIGNRKQQM